MSNLSLLWRWYWPDQLAVRYPVDRMTGHVETDRKAGGPARSSGQPGTAGTSVEIPNKKYMNSESNPLL